jgi:type VI secretion system protein ImpH
LATQSRAANSGLTDFEIADLLEEQPYCFRFFQAVRLLEHISRNRQSIGKFVPPASEAVHFGVPATLAFPASEIQSITYAENQPAKMTVNFMGLTGPSGILPHYYTELVAARLVAGDRTLADFLDIFNHRLISLFYRAWAKYHFSLAYEQSDIDRFSRELLALIGLGTPGLQSRQDVLDDSFIYYTGLLMGHCRSATNLQQLIADYFDVNVEIEEFAGSWYALDSEMQTCMDESEADSNQLGFGVIAGDEIWHDESGIRIKLGPLSLDQYVAFLPGGEAHKRLQSLTRFFSGDELDFEIQLFLRRQQVPACELGAESPVNPRLGLLTWIKSAPFQHEADTVFRLQG